MAISPELARLYSSAPDNEIIMDAVILSCPAWKEDVNLITNVIQDTVKQYPAGNDRMFIPAKFGLSRPKEDDTGVIEISMEFDVTKELYDLLESAEKLSNNITATFICYVEALAVPASPPYVLQMDSVTVTEKKVSFNARNAGLVNREFPYRVVLADSYPGLSR